MTRVYTAKTEGTFPYRCESCGFRGIGSAFGQSATSKLNEEDAVESARLAARDAVQMARCPECGVRDEAEVGRVRREAVIHGALVCLGASLGVPLLGWLRMGEVGLWAVFGPVLGVFAFVLIMHLRFGGRMRQADLAVIVPEEVDEEE